VEIACGYNPHNGASGKRAKRDEGTGLAEPTYDKLQAQAYDGWHPMTVNERRRYSNPHSARTEDFTDAFGSEVEFPPPDTSAQASKMNKRRQAEFIKSKAAEVSRCRFQDIG
jgi:hypothetical protein